MRARCDWDEFQEWAAFVARPDHSPEASAEHTGVDPGAGAGGGAALRHRRQRRDLLRPRGHRAQPGVDDGDGDRQPRDGDRQHRAAGRGGEPAARAEQRAGRLRHGELPARAVGLPARLGPGGARAVREGMGLHASTASRACGSRTCSTRRSRGRSGRSTSRARTSCSRTRTQTHVAAGLAAMDCVVVQDLFLNETANYAHVFLPGSTFLEKDGTFTNAERRIQRDPQGDGAEERLRRLGDHPADRAGGGARLELRATRPRSWTRSPG